MHCAGLVRLGWQPGDLPLPAQAVQDLLAACQREKNSDAL